MRQFIIRILNVLCIIGALFCYQRYANDRAAVVAAHEAEEKEAKALEKEYAKMLSDAEEASGYQDGVWEGSGTGFGGEIKLAITIADHQISKVEILSAEAEDPDYLSIASALLDQIVEEQSADLDTVSGATFSSTGILEAASAALEEAE